MGLDMYLEKRVYVKNWDHFTPDRKWSITVSEGGKSLRSKLPIIKLVYGAAYWRKANAIHKWFVENCQDGEDKCHETYVSEEQLETLLNLCQKVRDLSKMEDGIVSKGWRYTPSQGGQAILEKGKVVTNAEQVAELLPTEGGFFFGSTDYDEGYLSDVEDTIRQLEIALADPLEGDFYYQASW